MMRDSMAGETLPVIVKSVKSSASGTRSRIASSTCSPPRIPVSQSWMTATLPNILLPLRVRRRCQGVVPFRRTRVAEMVVAKILLGFDLAQTADADVLSRSFAQILSQRVLDHLAMLTRLLR